MHLNGVDLNLLVGLDALLTHKNVTRAAEQLKVTQPAMSAALQRLRVHVGDPLLQPVGRELMLTPRAHAIQQPVKSLLAQICNILNYDADFDPQRSERRFVLAMSEYCAEVLAPGLTRHLSEHAPNVFVHLERIGMDSVERLRDRRIDACLTVEHSGLLTEADTEFAQQGLFSDVWVMVCDAANHRIGNSVAYRDLSQQPFVDVHCAGLKSALANALHAQELRPKIVAILPSFHSAMRAIADSDCVGIVPLRAAQAHAPRLGLRIVPSPLPSPALNQLIIYHHGSVSDPGQRWLHKVLHETVARLDGADRRGGTSALPVGVNGLRIPDMRRVQ